MKNQRVLGSTIAIALLLLLISMMIAVGAPAADAQRVDCENVTYNESVIRVCTSVEGEPVATPTPVPTSTPTPVPTATPSAADDDKEEDEADPTSSGEDDDDAEDDVEELDAGPSGQPDSVDRGDRGSRNLDAEADVPTPSDDTPADDQAADADEDDELEPADVSRLDDADNGEDTTAIDDDSETSDQGEVAPVETGSSAVFDSTPKPPPDNVALLASLAALVGLGGVFFLGARANRRDDSHE